jgi:hypothetical protein
MPKAYSGTVHFWAEVNADHAWPEPDYTNNRWPPVSGTDNVEFKPRRPFGVGYLLVEYLPKPSHDFQPFNWPSNKPDPTWVASKAARGVFNDIYPSDSLGYQMFGAGWWTYKNLPDVRDNYIDPYGKSVCGYCEVFNHLTKVWAAAKALGGSVPDQLFAWFPVGAMSGAPSGPGVAAAPPPVWTGSGRAAFGEDKADVFAHEVGHNLALYHAPCPPPSLSPALAPPNPDPQWPYWEDKAAPSHNWTRDPGEEGSALIGEIGWNVATYKTTDPYTADWMSYCFPKWITPYHWNKLFNALAPSPAPRTGAAAAAQSVALVSGLISDNDTGQLDAILALQGNPASATLPSGSQYCLTLQDASNAPVATHCFDLSFTNPESGAPVSVAPFAYALPFPGTVGRVVLKHGAAVLDERSSSAHAPEISLTSPAGGEVWDGIETVVWTASDADGDDLTFAVFYSSDDGASWTPVALDLTESSYALDTTALPGGDAVRIRVLASDGFLTTTVDSPRFSVPAKTPMAVIDAPEADASVPQEQALYLMGSAYDPEDGSLADNALSWWSDRDGLLGRGATVIVPGLTLSAGWHTITLMAADGDNQIGTATTRIEVAAAAAACAGDCSDDGSVTVDELLVMVNIALGNAPASGCQAGDVSGDGQITVDEILTAVNNALNGCQ